MKCFPMVLIAATSLLCAQSSHARDVGKSIIYGPGFNSCGQWTDARKSHSVTEVAMSGWALGYVSAAGVYGTQDLKHTDASGIFNYLDTYCAAHPLNAFVTAALGLTGELIPDKK